MENESLKRQTSVATHKEADSEEGFDNNQVSKIVDSRAKTKEVNSSFSKKVNDIMRDKNIKAAQIPDSKEEFEDEEVAKLVEKSENMEAKARNGHIREATGLFIEIFGEITVHLKPENSPVQALQQVCQDPQ